MCRDLHQRDLLPPPKGCTEMSFKFSVKTLIESACSQNNCHFLVSTVVKIEKAEMI